MRPSLPERSFASPTFDQLVDDPGGLLAELTFTGYYPAVPWLAYVLVGMAVGRLDLTSRRTAGLLAAGGAVAAVLATVVSRALTARPAVQEALLTDPPAPDVDAAALLDRISAGLPGTTPTDGAWQWLLVVAPHTATPFDLRRRSARRSSSSGCACWPWTLVGPAGRRTAAIFFGAGTMTLTLYSVHVVAALAGPPARRAARQLLLPRDAPARGRRRVRGHPHPRAARGAGGRRLPGGRRSP